MKGLNKVLMAGLLMLGLAIPCYAEKIVAAGSTTVLPIAQKAAEVFMNSNQNAHDAVRVRGVEGRNSSDNSGHGLFV